MRKPIKDRTVPCVYMVVNFNNGRYYIGKSADAFSRWREHFFGMKFNQYKDKGVGKSLMQEDFKAGRYAKWGFFCLCERSNKSLIDELEAYLIRIMNPHYNTMMANKKGEIAKYDAAFALVPDFLYSWIAPELKTMQGMTFWDWGQLYQRLVQLRAIGFSSRTKGEYTEMLQEVYPEHFKFQGNKIARIKNF